MPDKILETPQDDPEQDPAVEELYTAAGPAEDAAFAADLPQAGGFDPADGTPLDSPGDEPPPQPQAPSAPAEGATAAGPAPPQPELADLDAAARSGGPSFGTWLRRQREMREIDLREIADKTKISLRYLKAMEQDRFELLPAPLFARGFLREYAKYVGLNADEVVNYYLSAHEAAVADELDETRARRAASSSRGPATRGALLVLLLIVAAALVAYFLFYRQSREEAGQAPPPPIAAPPVAEVPASQVPPPPAEPESTAPLVVTLDFIQQCWVEASVDGERRISRLYVAGESEKFEAQRSVTLESVGNAGGVEVQVNGVPYDLGAGEGQTVHDVQIDLATADRLRSRAG